MKTPRLFAVFVCLVLAFTIFQGSRWHWRPEPDWHPSWWQSHTWARVGFIISLPIPLPVVFLQEAGVSSDWILWPALAIGVVCEFAVTYFAALGLAKLFLKIYHRVRHDAVA